PLRLSARCAVLSLASTPPEKHTLSLHDALPIYRDLDDDTVAHDVGGRGRAVGHAGTGRLGRRLGQRSVDGEVGEVHLRVERDDRSEEHTSELQSRENLVCRLLLEKKKKKPSLA